MVQTAIGNPRPVHIGESVDDCETLIGVILALWEPTPEEPDAITTMSNVIPEAFKFFHKFYRGELHIKDLYEAYHAFYHNGLTNKSYMTPGGDNLPIPYVKISNKDSTGKTWVWTLIGMVPIDHPIRIEEGAEVIYVVPFVAKNITLAEGA